MKPEPLDVRILRYPDFGRGSSAISAVQGDIGLSNDAFVDGTHPTDLGMQQYAEAYQKKLINITKNKTLNLFKTDP